MKIEFIGYQGDPWGHPFPLFNIRGAKKFGIPTDDTLNGADLKKKGIKLPTYPTYTQWRAQIEKQNK